MPLVFPIGGASSTSREVTSAALATLIQGTGLSASPGLATAIVRGEGRYPSSGAARVRGVGTRAALSLLDAGEVRGADASGSIDAGAVELEAVRGGLTVNVLTSNAVQMGADVGNSGETSASRLSAAVGSIDAARRELETAAASTAIRGVLARSAPASLHQETRSLRAARNSILISVERKGASLSALDTGRTSQSTAPASVEAEAAEGVDVIVDIIDDVVKTIRGDVC